MEIKMKKPLNMSLGYFRADISKMTAPHLVYDNPFDPVSLSMPIDSINVVLSASPYIAIKSGAVCLTLSHVQTVKRSIKGGRRSYRIICGDYNASNDPVSVEYRIFCGELAGKTV